MKVEIFPDKAALGAAAAQEAASLITAAIEERGSARIIAATGASQFDFLAALTRIAGIQWQKVTMFHLDEYVGLPEDHPASFRGYLRARLISKVDIGEYHLLNPAGDPQQECRRVGKIIAESPVDVAFVGIGENGHLAFNDPPADFDTEEPYLVVTLDLACRQQQLGEGWFASLQEVPKQAVSMSIRQIMKSRSILCIVPEARKAKAVKATLGGPISADIPASILRRHADTIMYLDMESSALLDSAELPR